MKPLCIGLLCLCWFGCAGGGAASNPAGDATLITIEGQITTRGNTPFTALMLETDQRNLYVLVLRDAEEQAIAPTLPARYRITGLVYAGDWNGLRLAHLRATMVERL